jgi:hypothetical protein
MIGDTLPIRGYVTQDKFLVGRAALDIERTLGLHAGRLNGGAVIARLSRLPMQSEFDLGAYSQTAAHRYRTPGGLDIGRLKSLAMSGWSLTGPNRLVKVIPAIAHDSLLSDDAQYPPGLGAPQWVIRKETPIEGIVVAELKSGAEHYRPQK